MPIGSHAARFLVAALFAAGGVAIEATAGESPSTASSPASPSTATAGRPRVCLVLSGGGARGAAHVGVLRELEALRVPIDCIAGTSMGALVGAAYASGHSVAEMERVIAGLSTDALFNERPLRPEQSMRRKQDDLTNLVGPELGYRDGELLLGKGFVSGVQIEAVMRRLARIQGAVRFDDLPIPYRAVATDLVSGRAVVFERGELAAVMRASMSVPGAVSPAEVDGMLLVDGGLTNNLPIDVARRMGAEVVIAVNLGTPLFKREALGSVIGVTGQMVNILTEQNVRASIASLRASDILIEPDLGELSAGDFSGMQEAVRIGAAAVRKAADRLVALAVPEGTHARTASARTAPRPRDTRPIEAIRFEGLERVNPRYVEGLLDTKAGRPVDPDVLDRDLARIHGSGDFEHVSYRVTDEEGRHTLVIRAAEKSWGPGYLRFGLGLSSDFRGNAYFNLLGRYRRAWINDLGGELRGDVQIGRVDRLAAELYQPLFADRSLFVAPQFEAEQHPLELFNGNRRIARYVVRYDTVGADVGSEIPKFGELRLGFRVGSSHVRLDTGAGNLPDAANSRIGRLNARFNVDQLDSVNFPRVGYSLLLNAAGSRRALGAESTHRRWDAAGTLVRSFGENTVNLGLRVSRPYGSGGVPAADLVQWGGFLQQSGYAPGALVAESISFARLMLYRRLATLPLFEGLYAGLSLEVGKLEGRVLDNAPDATLRSGSLFLAFDSPLGPLYLAYGRASEGQYSYYFFLGKPW